MQSHAELSVDDLLLRREARALRILTRGRIAFAAIIMVLVAVNPVPRQAFPVVAPMLFGFALINVGFLRLLRGFRWLRLVGLGGSVIDALLLAGIALTLYFAIAKGAYTPLVLVKMPLLPISLCFVTVSALALRPQYPAILTAASVLIYGLVLLFAALDERTVWAENVDQLATSSAAPPELVVAHMVFMLLIGGALMLTTRSARALVHRAAELEAERSRTKRQQAQLLMESKVGALGHMVAGISHELNSPLAAVRSSAELTPRALDSIEAGLAQPGDAAIARKAARAASALRTTGQSTLEATSRMAQTLSTLRNFARLDQAELQRTDINADLDDTLKLLSVGSTRIEIVRDYGELPGVLCNPGQLNQVFMTILTNGCQAIEGTGTLTIGTRAAGDTVQVSIADTGRGMSEQQLGSLFDIQLSSGNDARVAASFGLATAQNTIHRHGGHISVESTPGNGATFTIELPVAAG